MNVPLVQLIRLAVYFSSGAVAMAADLAVPNGYLNVEGGSFSYYPWSGPPGVRFQQVYAASQFGPISGSGGGIISGFEFRMDTPLGRHTFVTITNVLICFSTTTRAPDQLSPHFAENVGPDNQVVFGSANLTRTLFHGEVPPEEFSDFSIPMSSFFSYNPNVGNLLVDIQIFGGTSVAVPPFDAISLTGDSVSSVHGLIGDASGTLSTVGLVTRFIVTPVPEPGVVSLIALVVGSGLSVRLWNKRRNHHGINGRTAS